MSRQKIIEIWVGALVLMSLVSLMVVAFKVSNFQGWKDRPTYSISALYMNVGGLKARAPVKISGVVVGRVVSIAIDPQTFQARVIMDIYKEFDNLSIDTSGSILTSGLLGDQYVALQPGGDEEMLQDGDQLFLTQSALVLEELIGQFLTKSASN